MPRIIECPNCGNTEELPIDEQRWHSQHFKWLNGESIYICNICGSTAKSEEHEWIL
ncbi:MAG: hypothetical protein ACOC4M_08165 [Promethearchaeia archaeon]